MSHRQKIRKPRGPRDPDFHAGHILLKFKIGTTEQQIQDFLAEKKFKVIDHVAKLNIYILGVPEGQEKALVAELRIHALVTWVTLHTVTHTIC